MAEPSKHRTCEAFRDLRWRLPSGAVHGDAHLEQFVVTDDDFGLADFDNAGYGPAIVDLVRYAASLHLACREIEGGCDPEQAVTAYFNAYRTALITLSRETNRRLWLACAPDWAPNRRRGCTGPTA